MGRALLLAIVALLVLGVLPASAQSRAPRRDLTPGPASQHEEQLSGADFVRPLAQAGKSRTLASALVEVARQSRDAGRAAGLRQAQAGGVAVRGDQVRVVIQPDSPSSVQAVEAVVARAGGTVETSSGGQVQALVPPAGLEQVASAPGVQHVQSARRLIPDAIAGQEVNASGAKTWHDKGAAGGGVKIAILDGDFIGYRDRQASGDLPTNLTTADFCGSDGFENDLDGGHGTAVAEIVYEMAPGAQLYLVCAGTLNQNVDAVNYMIQQGIQIVNHSRGIFNTSRADGVYNASDAAFLPESLITKAYNAGILWVNSSGNSGATHWAGSFTDSDGDNILNFNGNDEGNNISIRAGGSVSLFLKWDSWPTTSDDFDLYLSNTATGQVLAYSVNEQSGSQTPTEDLFFRNTTGSTLNAFVSIVKYRASSNPSFDLFVEGSLATLPQFTVAAGSLTDFGVSPRALVVGASCWETPTSIENFSSRGPTINPSVTGVKPDMTGLDGMSNGTYGTYTGCDGAEGFFGTSAAAPTVAAAAALARDANSSLTTHDALKTKVKTMVREAGEAGTDTTFGTGVLTMGDLSSPTATCTTAGRAQVSVSTSKSSDTLTTTLTATGSSNAILSVAFGDSGGNLANALISVPNGPTNLKSAATYYTSFSSPPTSVTFTTKRQTAGQTVTVPLVVQDRCGEWKSFVGGGPSAGF